MGSILTALKKAHFTYSFIAGHPLTKDHKLAAMGRYGRWQIASRISRKKRIVPFVNGTKLEVGPSMTGATGNIYVGLHEFRDMAFVLHLLRAGDTFFDVGANVGTYTVLAAGAAEAAVVAFEPSAVTYAHLLDNVRVNGLQDKVLAVRCAVGGARGTVRFTSGRDTVNHVIDEAEAGSESVDLCPLDDYADRTPAAIKVDVEGFEDAVLVGAGRLLRSPGLRAILIEANRLGTRYGKTNEGVHETLVASGFSLCDYDPFRRELAVDDSSRPGNEGNGLYVRDISDVRGRLSDARPFVVLNRTI